MIKHSLMGAWLCGLSSVVLVVLFGVMLEQSRHEGVLFYGLLAIMAGIGAGAFVVVAEIRGLKEILKDISIALACDSDDGSDDFLP